jgi:hypothetical protein
MEAAPGFGQLGPAPAIPIASASPSQAAREVGRPNPMANSLAVVVALAVFSGGCFLAPVLFWIFGFVAFAAYNFILKQLSNAEQAERFRKILSDAEERFNRGNSDWQVRGG